MRAEGGCMILSRVFRESFMNEVAPEQRSKDLQR